MGLWRHSRREALDSVMCRDETHVRYGMANEGSIRRQCECWVLAHPNLEFNFATSVSGSCLGLRALASDVFIGKNTQYLRPRNTVFLVENSPGDIPIIARNLPPATASPRKRKRIDALYFSL